MAASPCPAEGRQMPSSPGRSCALLAQHTWCHTHSLLKSNRGLPDEYGIILPTLKHGTPYHCNLSNRGNSKGPTGIWKD